jgi:hypothetical protein
MPRCKACRADFSATSGTLFAWHKLPLRIYLMAIAVFCNEVKGKTRVRGHWADALKLPGFSEGCGGRIPGVCLCGSGVGDRIGDREDLLGY